MPRSKNCSPDADNCLTGAGSSAFQLAHGFNLGLLETAQRAADLLYRDKSVSEHHFVPTSSSFLLDALGVEILDNLLVQVQRLPQLQAILKSHLGNRIVIDLDQAWLRRQYPPSRYPPQHAPHSWHQDGALAFDFASLGSCEPPANALLDMLTCWIPLTPCGQDAPGLELIAQPVNRLFPPHQLTDQSLRATFDEHEFQTPATQPGDVLVMTPGCLHRTHVTPAMQHDRSSMELRFFPANRIHQRLQSDRFEQV